MSCRTTPAGSFATTFVQRLYGLEDGQCTSLFHQLRRTYQTVAHAHGDLPGNSPEAYRLQAAVMATTLSTSDRWTPALRARAQERFARVNAAPVPEEGGLRYAFINMMDTARDARRALQTQQERVASRWVGMTADDVSDEFARLYREFGTLTDEQQQNAVPLFDTIVGAPQDNASQYAIGVLASALRCSICGQFVADPGRTRRAHECPPPGQRPLLAFLAPVAAPAATIAAPQAQEDDEEEEEQYWDDDYDSDDDEDYNPPAHRIALNNRTTGQGGEWVGEVVPWSATAFQSDYDAARARLSAGATSIPGFEAPGEGEVTGGLGSRGTGTSFGIELELDFPDDEWPYTARHELARRLYEEGVTASPFVERWHFVGDDRPGGDFIESPSNWICEFDRSVDNVDGERGIEIKSQILYDEPATWANLEKICRIAEELGAKPTLKTGLHVNVGGSRFPSEDPAAHNALLRLAGAYDDTIIRLAHNPASSSAHRGRAFCNFAPVPESGYRDVAQARAYSNHYQAFNLGHLPAGAQSHQRSSRVEVRMWDSTTDPGRIQAAVATSLALVKLATDLEKPGQPLEPMGSHRRDFGRSRLTGEQWEKSTESFRRFMTLMEKAGLRSSTHKSALTTMFAESRWQNS